MFYLYLNPSKIVDVNKRSIFSWILISAIIFVSLKTLSQGSYSWVNHYGGAGDDVGYAIANADSSIYLGGWFEGSVAFGETVLTSSGYSDMFIVRMTYSGDIIWARRFGGIGTDNIVGITADHAGNVYFSGFCSEYSDFGSYLFPGFGGWDAFVCRVTKEGTVKWAITGGGWYDDQTYRINLNDNCDRIAFTGLYKDFATFGPYLLPPWGGRDVFVATIDTSGSYLWLDFFGNFSDDVGYALDFDSLNNLYLTGYFYSTHLNFGHHGLTNAGEFDTYLTKFNSYGAVLWAKSIGGNNSELPRHLEVIGSNIYMGGYQYGSGDFLGIQLNSLGGSQDSFVIKADTAGYGIWGVNGLSGDADEMICLSVIPGNGVFVSGGYKGILNVAGQLFPSTGDYDAFIVSLDEYSGDPIGCATGGGADGDVFFGISADSNTIYSTGCFIGEAKFGEHIIESSGLRDILICRLNDLILNLNRMNSENQDIEVFPNPFSDYTTCKISGNILSNIRLELYNGFGYIVWSSEGSIGNYINIPRGKLPSGNYYLGAMRDKHWISWVKLIIN